MSIIEEIIEILSSQFGRSNISGEAAFDDINLDLDSLEMVKLYIAVEDRFDVILDYDSDYQTIQEMAEAILRLRSIK